MKTPKERCKDVVGALVKLRIEIETRGGERYPAGSRWRVYQTHRGRFGIEMVDAEGKTVLGQHGGIKHIIRKVRREDFEIEAAR